MFLGRKHIALISLFLNVVLSSTLVIATPFNLTLPHQHPNPELVVQELQQRVHVSVTRRQLFEKQEKDQSSCLTGNPIDDCWRCDPNWISNRQALADCGIGFGREALGGKGGSIYVVTDSSDPDPKNPPKGTLRYGVAQPRQLWITFSKNMVIKLTEELIMTSFKTIDGRGADVHIVGSGCIAIHSSTNIIIHNIHIHDCVPSMGSVNADGDGISIMSSSKIWVDHCSLAQCKDGLIDVTLGSTAVTISNNYFSHHVKVMLLGHNDEFEADRGMQVTVAFNHFGEGLTERMPRCRLGYFHVVNNDYTPWILYAVGGSGNPTINSEGNRYVASSNPKAKQVTMRMDADKDEWSKWNWRTIGDVMVNGAFFVASGDGLDLEYVKASSLEPRSANMIDQLTLNAGVFGDNTKCTNGACGGGGIIYGNDASPAAPIFFLHLLILLCVLCWYQTTSRIGYACQ